jgi:hypothetical protein
MSSSAQSISFTVIGDTANTAARLQVLIWTLGVPLVIGDPPVKAQRKALR